MLMNSHVYQQHRRVQKEDARIFLDGTDITSVCVEADDQAGTATLIVLDENQPAGAPTISRFKWKDGQPLTESKRGKVEIRFTPIQEKAA